MSRSLRSMGTAVKRLALPLLAVKRFAVPLLALSLLTVHRARTAISASTSTRSPSLKLTANKVRRPFTAATSVMQSVSDVMRRRRMPPPRPAVSAPAFHECDG